MVARTPSRRHEDRRCTGRCTESERSPGGLQEDEPSRDQGALDAPMLSQSTNHGTRGSRPEQLAMTATPRPAGTQDDELDLPQQACWRCFMIKAGLSPTRLRRKVLALCAEANYVGDLISELAHEARDQQQALLLAGRAHRIAIEVVSPEIFGHVFAADEGEAD